MYRCNCLGYYVFINKGCGRNYSCLVCRRNTSIPCSDYHVPYSYLQKRIQMDRLEKFEVSVDLLFINACDCERNDYSSGRGSYQQPYFTDKCLLPYPGIFRKYGSWFAEIQLAGFYRRSFVFQRHPFYLLGWY